jgi:hypothetical protein
MNSPENDKPWYASRAIWGGLIALAASLVGLLGYTISPADQAAIADLVLPIASGIGGGLAIVGRIRATRRIG